MLIWDFNSRILQLGRFELRWYGVLFALMLMGAYHLWRWQITRSGRSEAVAETFLTAGVIAVIGGSRLGHVLFYEPQKYLADPLEILFVWRGGLASHGATIGLFIAMVWFSRKHAFPLIDVMDRISFSACCGVIMVRLGNFANSEIVGRVTDAVSAPFAVKFVRCEQDRGLVRVAGDFAEVPWRHPAQLYEAAIGITVIAVLYAVDRRFGERRPRGLLAAIFLTLYFGGRVVTEFFKEFEGLKASESTFTMGQYLSAPLALAGLFMFAWVAVNAVRKGRSA
ncbi:MAG: prolipoprotein diacylglyceryl transferase [Myxococcales bacterium]|nr:prolipoprotein diacylglyceryl transferase [Myxococcales bacterium]